MNLPNIKLKLNADLSVIGTGSNVVQKYSAFKNLENNSSDISELTLPLRLSTLDAELNIDKPIEVKTELSYDNSINLIVNDKVNPVKIVNSRFYLTDNNSYKIADRDGDLDTNIYTKNNFKSETTLIKTVKSVVNLSFDGISVGGKMPVGNYTFYFKLSDSDGNESDFVAESGKVVCHIGSVNQPKEIRGGQLNENSNKLIKFKLTNLDRSYNFINVYYTRSTGNEDNEIIEAYKIIDKIGIHSNNVSITITGNEVHQPISIDEINIKYTNFTSIKSVENCQNMTFAGNVTNNYELYKTLRDYSLYITPELSNSNVIEKLNHDYQPVSLSTSEYGYEYYNAKNIYYRLGYWDEEIYRFGIVYIMNDYSLSPVFDIRGIKELSIGTQFKNYSFLDTINYDELFRIKDTDENSKGVFKIKLDPINNIPAWDSRSTYNSGNFVYTYYTEISGKCIYMSKVNNNSNNDPPGDLTDNNYWKVIGSTSTYVSTYHPATFNGSGVIYPIGIKFNFTSDLINGYTNGTISKKGLKDLTKGFFIVRQKRIPNILAQGIAIGTSKNAYIPVIPTSKDNNDDRWVSESFIKSNNNKPELQRNIFYLREPDGTPKLVNRNALLCPEASVRKSIFSSLFNSSEFSLTISKYKPNDLFFIPDNKNIQWHENELWWDSSWNSGFTNCSLSLIDSGIDLIQNGDYKFSSKSGDSNVAYTFSDPLYGDYFDVNNNLITYVDGNVNNKRTNTDQGKTCNYTDSKIRGEFNTYIGTNITGLTPCRTYNICSKDYMDFNTNWENHFRIRYNDSSPFMSISDRISWNKITNNSTTTQYRGDCYINTYTHRMNWNFIDPELPTNKRIVDPYTWYKNFRMVKKASVVIAGESYNPDIDPPTDKNTFSSTLSYRKLLPLFTYKKVTEPVGSGDIGDTAVSGLIDVESSGYKKYSERNGIFGAEKINRPDVNAVPIGHWVTFTVCSNVNLAMRDLDYSRPEEEALHKQKRGFYPLQSLDPNNHLPESEVLNSGISKTIGDKYYFEIPDVPFIKTNFATRIYYSDILTRSTFANNNRIFKSVNYTDYTTEYGALIKLVEWYGSLVAIMEHGIMMIPVNERALMANESGQNVYINTEKVLPQNPRIVSNTFGSLWADSIIKTPKFIYGIDTVAKKIWRTNGEQIELISDMKIQKFLNDHIELKEINKDETIHTNYIKTHYNAFKQDVMFVFKYGTNKWNLCWNEIIDKWVTQYTWFPEFSENINNIFYTFADSKYHTLSSNYLYKHGFAGTEELEGDIDSTKWYGDLHPFEFEFVVADMPGVQKIFDNLKIISNSAEPDSLFYEVVGEGFEWNKYKSAIQPFTTQNNYSDYLSDNTSIKKIPYILKQNFDVNDSTSFYNKTRTITTSPLNITAARDLALKVNNKTKEVLVNCYQKGLNIKEFGRMRGNMQYLEDSWDIQIQPITFNYAYRENNVFGITPNKYEMKIRDKYIKIRVRYKGDKYAIINAIKTLYTISYA